MRIAIVHSYYSASQPSGENVVVDAQAAALQRAGHEVLIVSRRSDDSIGSSKFGTLRAGIAVATGWGDDPRTELMAFRPDLVHVHNLFPNWSRRWLSHWHTPVVATLHNFRSYCSTGTLYRDGKPCTECLDVGTHRAVVNKCYRGSAAATIPLAIATRGGARTDEVINRADALITLSVRASTMHLAAGVGEGRIRTVPNFVKDPGVSSQLVIGHRWAVTGRLSPEKGMLELLRAWPADVDLDIIGGGPLRQELESMAPDSVRFHGTVDQILVSAFLHQAHGFIFPSRWAEGAVPLSYVEALAAARPVIALAGNGAADDVIESGAGLVVSSWAELPEAMQTINDSWLEYSTAARRHFELNYSEAIWVKSMTAVYEDALNLASGK